MGSIIPLWLAIVYTLFVLVLIPVYWKRYGPANFLWFSDISLFFIGIALWTESRMLVSMIAVGVLFLELIWNLDYFGRLLTGRELLGLSGYMFDKQKSLFLRGLSLFHVFLPVIIIWLLTEWGYETSALCWQTALAWVVLPVCYFFTDPNENINWVYGFGNKPKQRISQRLYFVLSLFFFPIVIYLPSHFLLQWIFN